MNYNLHKNECERTIRKKFNNCSLHTSFLMSKATRLLEFASMNDNVTKWGYGTTHIRFFRELNPIPVTICTLTDPGLDSVLNGISDGTYIAVDVKFHPNVRTERKPIAIFQFCSSRGCVILLNEQHQTNNRILRSFFESNRFVGKHIYRAIDEITAFFDDQIDIEIIDINDSDMAHEASLIELAKSNLGHTTFGYDKSETIWNFTGLFPLTVKQVVYYAFWVYCVYELNRHNKFHNDPRQRSLIESRHSSLFASRISADDINDEAARQSTSSFYASRLAYGNEPGRYSPRRSSYYQDNVPSTLAYYHQDRPYSPGRDRPSKPKYSSMQINNYSNVGRALASSRGGFGGYDYGRHNNSSTGRDGVEPRGRRISPRGERDGYQWDRMSDDYVNAEIKRIMEAPDPEDNISNMSGHSKGSAEVTSHRSTERQLAEGLPQDRVPSVNIQSRGGLSTDRQSQSRVSSTKQSLGRLSSRPPTEGAQTDRQSFSRVSVQSKRSASSRPYPAYQRAAAQDRRISVVSDEPDDGNYYDPEHVTNNSSVAPQSRRQLFYTVSENNLTEVLCSNFGFNHEKFFDSLNNETRSRILASIG